MLGKRCNGSSADHESQESDSSTSDKRNKISIDLTSSSPSQPPSPRGFPGFSTLVFNTCDFPELASPTFGLPMLIHDDMMGKVGGVNVGPSENYHLGIMKELDVILRKWSDYTGNVAEVADVFSNLQYEVGLGMETLVSVNEMRAKPSTESIQRTTTAMQVYISL